MDWRVASPPSRKWESKARPVKTSADLPSLTCLSDVFYRSPPRTNPLERGGKSIFPRLRNPFLGGVQNPPLLHHQRTPPWLTIRAATGGGKGGRHLLTSQHLQTSPQIKTSGNTTTPPWHHRWKHFSQAGKLQAGFDIKITVPLASDKLELCSIGQIKDGLWVRLWGDIHRWRFSLQRDFGPDTVLVLSQETLCNKWHFLITIFTENPGNCKYLYFLEL